MGDLAVLLLLGVLLSGVFVAAGVVPVRVTDWIDRRWLAPRPVDVEETT